MGKMVSHELTSESFMPVKAAAPTAINSTRLITAWRSFIALVELPFVYSRLYDQAMQAFEDGAMAGHRRDF